jgi:hypothetical protein
MSIDAPRLPGKKSSRRQEKGRRKRGYSSSFLGSFGQRAPSGYDAQSDAAITQKSLSAQRRLQIGSTKKTKVVAYDRVLRAYSRVSRMVAGKRMAVVFRDTPEPIPDFVLRTLESDSAGEAERANAIIHAEAMSFDADQIRRLGPILHQYIERYRDSNDPTTVIAVGCAVRTYIASMPMADFGSIATFLEADHRASPSLSAQIELTKMAVRKLTANPPQLADSQPALAKQLFDIVESYLNARCLAQDKIGAIALNAVLALGLLRSRHMADVLDRLHALSVAWFKGLLSREATWLCEEVASRLSADRHDECLAGLRALQIQSLSVIP